MTSYINYNGGEGNETVDEFDKGKEARQAIADYRQSDPTGTYWISSRPCKGWKTSTMIALTEAHRRNGEMMMKQFETTIGTDGSRILLINRSHFGPTYQGEWYICFLPPKVS